MAAHSKKNWQYGIVLYIVTVCAQLVPVIVNAIENGQNWMTMLIPSLTFVSLLTLPAIYIGLTLGKQIVPGLAHPTNTLVSKQGVIFALLTAIPLGVGLLALRWILAEHLPNTIPEYGFRGPLGGFLVSLGAAIGEEVWFRFGLMTLLLWICSKLLRQCKPSISVTCFVIFVVAFIFSVAHLPQLNSHGAYSQFAVVATILGNVAVACLYGWCFWRYGLISAIIAHFSLDIVLHMLPAYF
ncbi:MAG: CPBP family intramembrane glutamic endopeptidase [Aestuariibacter sp.]